MISIIVAIARDGAIGRKGDLPFHLSPDLRHFKEITMGKPVIMGRKTFESLPGGALKGRRNIIITRQKDYEGKGAETVSSLETALKFTADSDEVMIIGGGEIYREALPLADRIYLTKIDAVAEGADTFFPDIPPVFRISESTPEEVDPRSGLSYSFITLDRC